MNPANPVNHGSDDLNIGAAANYIEKTMGKGVPVLIGFMAKLIGLGGVSTKVKETIGEVQSKVDKPVEKVIDMIVSKGEAFVEKGKEVVSAGVEKVKSVMLPQKPFTLKNGEKYTLSVDDEANPKVIVRSEPQSVEELLAPV